MADIHNTEVSGEKLPHDQSEVCYVPIGHPFVQWRPKDLTSIYTHTVLYFTVLFK